MSDGLLESLRYWFAVFNVIGLPPAILYWFVLHPFVPFWRRLGARKSLTIIFVGFFLCAAGLFFVRNALLGIDFGPRRSFVIAGSVLLGAAIALQAITSRQLKRKTVIGLHELSPDQPGELLTEGAYAYTRNPRYVVILIAMVAYSLLLNYLGVWIVAGLCFPAIYAIVRLEEPELRQRFGAEYAEYCRRVPRFLPRRPKSSPARDIPTG